MRNSTWVALLVAMGALACGGVATEASGTGAQGLDGKQELTGGTEPHRPQAAPFPEPCPRIDGAQNAIYCVLDPVYEACINRQYEEEAPIPPNAQAIDAYAARMDALCGPPRYVDPECPRSYEPAGAPIGHGSSPPCSGPPPVCEQDPANQQLCTVETGLTVTLDGRCLDRICADSGEPCDPVVATSYRGCIASHVVDCLNTDVPPSLDFTDCYSAYCGEPPACSLARGGFAGTPGSEPYLGSACAPASGPYEGAGAAPGTAGTGPLDAGCGAGAGFGAAPGTAGTVGVGAAPGTAGTVGVGAGPGTAGTGSGPFEQGSGGAPSPL